MKIGGAVFDLDGTLLDSMEIWDHVGYDYLLSLKKTPRTDLREKLMPLSLRQAAEYFITDYQVSLSVQDIIDGINGRIEDFYYHTAPLKNGAKDLLEKLKKKGTKMCMATATDRHLAEAALKRNGIFKYFEGILTCTEVGFGKDSSFIYRKALELLNTDKEETYIFEDSLFALRTAKTDGFLVVGVYDVSADAGQAEIKSLSDIYVNSLEEMGNYL